MIPINILIILNYCRDLKKLVIIISVNSFVYDDTDYFNRVPLRFLVLISFMQFFATFGNSEGTNVETYETS